MGDERFEGGRGKRRERRDGKVEITKAGNEGRRKKVVKAMA